MEKKKAQFARIESYGIKTKKGAKRTTAKGVCGEVSRIDGFDKHVDDPAPPILLFGKDPFAELLPMIEKRAREQVKEAKKNGLPSPRQDRLVMCGGTFSYPVADDLNGFIDWQNDCLEYLKDKYGDKLQSVVLHVDENNPHLHFILCDFKTLRVDGGLDPAKTAQHNHRALKKTDGPGQMDALKQWQNEFHEAVSKKYGHERKIGARDRLHGTTKQVKAGLRVLEEAETTKARLDEREGTIRDASVRLKDYVGKVKIREQAVTQREKELEERERAVEVKEKEVSNGLKRLAELWKSLADRFDHLVKSGAQKEAQKVGLQFDDFRRQLKESKVEKQVMEELRRGEAGVTERTHPMYEGLGQKKPVVPMMGDTPKPPFTGGPRARV